MRRYETFSMLIFILFFTVLSVSYAGVGRTGAQILDFENDARANAMGRAFVAMSGDIGCIFHNPGGLGAMEEAQVMGAYTNTGVRFADAGDDMYTFSLAAGAPVDLGLTDLPLGVIAAGLQASNNGEVLGFGGSYDLGMDWAMTLSYADQISNLAAGLSLKLIHQELGSASGNAYAVDMGLQYDLLKFFHSRNLAEANDPTLGLKVGAAVQNWGTKISLLDESQASPLPRKLSFGTSLNTCLRLRDFDPNSNAPVGFAMFRFHLSVEFTAYIDRFKETEEELLWAAENDKKIDKKEEGIGIYAFSFSNMGKKIGAEIWVMDLLAFRLGYENIPNVTGNRLVYGLGLRLPISNLIGALINRTSEANLFDRLYRETDRQMFLELDLAVNRGSAIGDGSRPITIAFKMGI